MTFFNAMSKIAGQFAFSNEKYEYGSHESDEELIESEQKIQHLWKNSNKNNSGVETLSNPYKKSTYTQKTDFLSKAAEFFLIIGGFGKEFEAIDEQIKQIDTVDYLNKSSSTEGEQKKKS